MLLFVYPMIELTGELRVVDHFGVAVLAGYGQSTAEDSLGEEFSYDIYEVGAQASWYLLKPFRGLHLGLEFDYMHVPTDEWGNANRTAVIDVLAVGPLVGYKVVSRGGFTCNIQAGVQYAAAAVEERDSSGDTDSTNDSELGLLLNLGLGWSL